VDEFTIKRFVDVGEARICYRRMGNGPALAFFHGYPLSGRTWQKVIVRLSSQFTCYAFDMVGLGDSTSQRIRDHSSQGQATVLQSALSALGIKSFSLIGNDSGGWIARELALLEPERTMCLVLTNTEIPGHRPPWINFYQTLARMPGATYAFRTMIASRLWRRSGMGFGGCFDDLELIEETFAHDFLLPLLVSDARMRRALRFLVRMKFGRMDQFKRLHRELKMPVAFVWGAADPTFPQKFARDMTNQFPNVVSFTSIPKGKLFMQEEFPEIVAKSIGETLNCV
jgi:pimeloyl-ACP methyl ester carboxylesterase